MLWLSIDSLKRVYCIASPSKLGLERSLFWDLDMRGLKKSKKHSIPMFDEYNVGFNVCDKYNRVLHDKSWSYRLSGDLRVCSDYISTCILINTYHLWIDAGGRNEARREVSWLQFCTDLAFEMVS